MMTDEEIDELGFMLEDKGMSHADIDAYFEHAGKKGMKWGVRRGKTTTGMSRGRSALVEINDNRITIAKHKLNGTKYTKTANIGKKFMGEERYKKSLNKTIFYANAQNNRVKSGKLWLRDRYAVYNLAQSPEALISVRHQ